MGVKRQQGGAFGVGMAFLGAAGKILPGIFGEKAKLTTNNNYNNRAQPPQLRPRPTPQYYPPPQYYRPPQYYPPPQYYRAPQKYYRAPQRPQRSQRPPPIKRLQKGSGIRPRRKNKKWRQHCV
jgi:hypothetical protein